MNTMAIIIKECNRTMEKYNPSTSIYKQAMLNREMAKKVSAKRMGMLKALYEDYKATAIKEGREVVKMRLFEA